jgi:hypothetical protein
MLLDRSISSRLDTKWNDEVYMQDGRILLLVLVAVMTDRRKDSESIYHGAKLLAEKWRDFVIYRCMDFLHIGWLQNLSEYSMFHHGFILIYGLTLISDTQSRCSRFSSRSPCKGPWTNPSHARFFPRHDFHSQMHGP